MIPATLPAPAPATDTKIVGTGGDADAEATFAHVLGQMFVLDSAGEETPATEEGPDGSMESPDETMAGAVVGAGGEQQAAEDAPAAAAGLADPGPASDRSGQQTRAHGSKPLEGSTPPRNFPQATVAAATPTGESQPLQPSSLPSADAAEVQTSPTPSQSPTEARPRPSADLATSPAPAGSATPAEPASVDVDADVDGDFIGDIDADVSRGPATEPGEEADAAGPRTTSDAEDGDADQRPNRRGPGNETTRTDTPSAATHRAGAVATTDTRVAPDQAVPTAPETSSPSVDRARAATATTPASDVAAPDDAAMPVNAPAPPATVAVTSAAVATPAQAPTPTPVPAQLVDHVTPLLNKGDGIHEVTIELDPVDLGRVRLEVTLDDGVVSVRVHADDPATRRLLASSIHELRASLTEAGVSAGDLDVRDGDIGRRERHETGERRRHASSHDDGRATPGDRPRPRTSSRSALDVLL